ncbi:hypothetical protein L1987_37000 [Smallanthus sonchifolius]|uniref:Uncharacterized protein n=1 Tax=Smallanthus sonchifolius TaxID=185202 RepID=A0ACB9HF47_9ASTR|nr:hypothetical protein L1987_37000 [Smallanthus sonchifolius]
MPIRNCFKGIIGNGEDVAFWLDPWITDVPLRLKFPGLFSLEMDKHCKVCARVGDLDPSQQARWAWKRPPSSSEEISDLQQLTSLLIGVRTGDAKDRWFWAAGNIKEFSVGNVRRLLQPREEDNGRFIMAWCKWVPLKCNIFAWRAELDKIPTKTALRRRNIQIADASCPFCNEGEDSVVHIFTTCMVATILWQHISSWCNVPCIYAFSFKDLLDVHVPLSVSVRAKEVLHGIIMIGCWSLWRARNECVFSDRKIKVENIISQVKALGFLWRLGYREKDCDGWRATFGYGKARNGDR